MCAKRLEGSEGIGFDRGSDIPALSVQDHRDARRYRGDDFFESLDALRAKSLKESAVWLKSRSVERSSFDQVKAELAGGRGTRMGQIVRMRVETHAEQGIDLTAARSEEVKEGGGHSGFPEHHSEQCHADVETVFHLPEISGARVAIHFHA